MLIGSLKDVSLAYGDKKILNQLNADIPKGACIAIVGANGAGKTTLLEILAGELPPSSGNVLWNGAPPEIAYVKQEDDAAERAWGRQEMLAYESKWHVPKSAAYESASGGERMKMRLAAAFAKNSDILLLDEPTNHLDQDGLKMLIDLIHHDERTIIMVSHDRYLLDRTAEIIFEIEHGKLTTYKGNYSKYQKEKQARQSALQKQYEAQQQKIAKVEKQMNALENWSSKAHAQSTKKDGVKEYYRVKAKKRDTQIKSMKKRLEAELAKDKIDKPEEAVDISFAFKGQRKKGKRVLELKDVGKTFGARWLFNEVSFTVQAGERLALIGPNGCGKSTLFKMILGKETHEGQLWKTNGMKIGYLSQTMTDLPDHLTLAEYFEAETYEEQGKCRIELANLGFSAEQWRLPLSALSQGERLKVKLMQFILNGMDVLVLDEPTNHLDLPSREQLEKTLDAYPGTLLFASHDRYFAERLAEGLLVFEEGTIRKVMMPLREWEEKKNTPEQPEMAAEERLRLETELQAVLGELSLLKPDHPRYAELDSKFKALNRQLKDL